MLYGGLIFDSRESFTNLDSKALFLLNKWAFEGDYDKTRVVKSNFNVASDTKSEEGNFKSMIVKFSKEFKKLAIGLMLKFHIHINERRKKLNWK